MERHLQALAIVGGAFGFLSIVAWGLLFYGRYLHMKNEAFRREQERS
jgi:hypothetical protein